MAELIDKVSPSLFPKMGDLLATTRCSDTEGQTLSKSPKLRGMLVCFWLLMGRSGKGDDGADAATDLGGLRQMIGLSMRVEPFFK